MTDLEKIERVYDLIIALVVAKKTVTVKNCFESVDVYYDTVYHIKIGKVHAESESLCELYSLVKYTLAKHVFNEDIQVLVDGDLFAVIK